MTQCVNAFSMTVKEHSFGPEICGLICVASFKDIPGL